jgi:hypothetical protein
LLQRVSLGLSNGASVATANPGEIIMAQVLGSGTGASQVKWPDDRPPRKSA